MNATDIKSSALDLDQDVYLMVLADVVANTVLSPVQARWIATFLADRNTSESLKALAPAFVKLGGPKMDRGFTARQLGRAVKAYQREAQAFLGENPYASDRESFLYLCGLRKTAIS